jgi:hypothetical protein
MSFLIRVINCRTIQVRQANQTKNIQNAAPCGVSALRRQMMREAAEAA